MLLTEELKNYVYNEVQTRLGEDSCGIFSLFGQDFSEKKRLIGKKLRVMKIIQKLLRML